MMQNGLSFNRRIDVMRMIVCAFTLALALLTAGCAAMDKVYWLKQGETLFSENKYMEAADAYAEILKLEKPDRGAYDYIGGCLAEQLSVSGRSMTDNESAVIRGRAIEAYQEALDFIIEREETRKKEAKMFLAQGNAKAANDVNRYVRDRILPKRIQIHVNLGRLLYQAEKYIESAVEFEQAVNLQMVNLLPVNLLFRYWLALAAENIPGEEAAALCKWEEFLQGARFSSTTREEYGITDEYLKRAEKGKRMLEKRVEKKYKEAARKEKR